MALRTQVDARLKKPLSNGWQTTHKDVLRGEREEILQALLDWTQLMSRPKLSATTPMQRRLRVLVPMIMRQRSALLATVVTSVGLHARFRRLSLLPTSPSLTYLIPPIGFFLTYSFRCCNTFSYFFLDII